MKIQSLEGDQVTQESVFHPSDCNSLQSFQLNTRFEDVSSLRILLEDASDFYGRIVIYNVDLIGNKAW